MSKGLLFVICGPSGAGKGTIYNRLLSEDKRLNRSVSVTTRAPRVGEIDGKSYHFKTITEYQQMIAADGFLETASVFNNYYGTPKAAVLETLSKGEDVVFEIDVVGAKQIKAKYPSSILIFIMTPDFNTLEHRLRSRGTETAEALKTRLSAAKSELNQYEMFNYIVFNEDLEKAVTDTRAIILAERCRINNNTNKIKQILEE